MTFSDESVEKAYQSWRIRRFEKFSHIFYLIVAVLETVQCISGAVLASNTHNIDLSTKKFYRSHGCGVFTYNSTCMHDFEKNESAAYRVIAIIHGTAAVVLFLTVGVLINRTRMTRIQILLRRRLFRWMAAIGWAGYIVLQILYAVSDRWSRVTMLVVGIRISLYVVAAMLLAGHRWPAKIFVSLVAVCAFCVKYLLLIEKEFDGSDASTVGIVSTKVYGCLAFAFFVFMLLFYAWQLEIETRELYVLHLGLRHDMTVARQRENPLSSQNISTWLHGDDRARGRKIDRRPTLLLAKGSKDGAESSKSISIPTTQTGPDDSGSQLQWYFYGSQDKVLSTSLTKRKQVRSPPGLSPTHKKNVGSSRDDGDQDGTDSVRERRGTTLENIAKRHETIELAVQQWAIDFKYITDMQNAPVSAGSAGQVFRATYLSAPVALKQVFTTMMDQDLDEKNLEEFANEVTTLSRLGGHPNIVHFLGLTKCPIESSVDMMPRLYFVTRWCPTTLEKLLERGSSPSSSPRRPPPFPPKPSHLRRVASTTLASHNSKSSSAAMRVRISAYAAVRMARQVAAGMSHLHLNKVLHRDLKPANILVTEAGDIQICDFGAAYKWSNVDARISKRRAMAGTVAFSPPELLSDSGVSLERFEDGCAVDIWSFGVLLVAIFTSNRPFAHDGTWTGGFSFDFCRAVASKGLRPHMPSNSPNDLKRLLEHCLCADPKQRKPFYKILKALRYVEESVRFSEAPTSRD